MFFEKGFGFSTTIHHFHIIFMIQHLFFVSLNLWHLLATLHRLIYKIFSALYVLSLRYQ